jgi:hypothetical protein
MEDSKLVCAEIRLSLKMARSLNILPALTALEYLS